MSKRKSIADIRRDYGDLSLTIEQALSTPFAQFERWFQEVLDNEKHDPTAMILATVDAAGRPDARVVLLKDYDNDEFGFFTNYNSAKAEQLAANGRASLLFYWPGMARQVRIRGVVHKMTDSESDTYFLSRPVDSQISAIVSSQSHVIDSRETLLERLCYFPDTL